MRTKKNSNLSSKIKGLSAILMSILLVVIYQNCAPPPAQIPEGGYTATSTSTGDIDEFAYDLSLDTFAYMSCAHENLTVTSTSTISYERESLFTFKVGAYTPGSGLRLAPQYYDDTRHYTQERFEEKLNQDKLNAPATLQMSLRKKADLSKHYVLTEQHVSYPLVRSLGHRSIAGELRKLPIGARTNFFKKLKGFYGRHVHGTLYGTHRSRSKRQELMSNLQNHAMVVMSYVDPTSGELADAPIIKVTENEQDKYLGIGFHLIEGGRKLNSMKEYNLTTMQEGRSWSCSNDMKFMIVSHNDYLKSFDVNGNNTLCPMTSDYEQIAANASYKSTIERVRAILDPAKSLWAINMAKKCIVEKAPLNCYPLEAQSGTPTDPKAIFVKYTNPTSCSELKGDCPQYLSVCTRQ